MLPATQFHLESRDMKNDFRDLWAQKKNASRLEQFEENTWKQTEMI